MTWLQVPDSPKTSTPDNLGPVFIAGHTYCAGDYAGAAKSGGCDRQSAYLGGLSAAHYTSSTMTVLTRQTCCTVQISMLAQQALEAIAGKLPRQHAFHKFVDILSKEQQDGLGEPPVIQVSHKSHCLSRFLHDSILQQPFSEIPALSGSSHACVARCQNELSFLISTHLRILWQGMTSKLML